MTMQEESHAISDVFEVEQLGETVVLTPTEDMGELHAAAVALGLQEVRGHLRHAEFKNVVLDFQRTDYFGSTVLNEFIHLWKEVRSRGGQMAFCGLSPHEREILKVTRLDHHWLVCESRNEALQQVQQAAKQTRC